MDKNLNQLPFELFCIMIPIKTTLYFLNNFLWEIIQFQNLLNSKLKISF